MDKKEKKLAEDGMKNAMSGMGSNPAAFLDAASLLGELCSQTFVTVVCMICVNLSLLGERKGHVSFATLLAIRSWPWNDAGKLCIR